MTPPHPPPRPSPAPPTQTRGSLRVPWLMFLSGDLLTSKMFTQTWQETPSRAAGGKRPRPITVPDEDWMESAIGGGAGGVGSAVAYQPPVFCTFSLLLLPN